MKITGAIIKDEKDNFFFGFVIQHPNICAQGDTPEEVDEKVNRYWKSYIERVGDARVEMKMMEA